MTSHVHPQGGNESTRCSLDKMPYDLHDRLILSPKPINLDDDPINALEAAIQRSSRNQSLNSSLNNLHHAPNGEGHYAENHNNSTKVPPRRKIFDYLCCVASSPKTPSKNKSKKQKGGLQISSPKPKQPVAIAPIKSDSVPSTRKDISSLKQPQTPKVDSSADDSSAAEWRDSREEEMVTFDEHGQQLVEIKTNLLGEPTPECRNRKCLVLDLDETLVHSSFLQVKNSDFKVKVELENKIHSVYVLKRPYLDVFLATLKPLYEIVMFTASMPQYANPVCDVIDTTGSMSHRLFRDSCIHFQRNYYKDLTVLGRDLDQTCIIDNSPLSFARQLRNALQVRSYYNDPEDRTLLELLPYLVEMSTADTVTGFLKNTTPRNNCALAAPSRLVFEFDDDVRRYEEFDECCPTHNNEESEEESELIDHDHHHDYVNGHNIGTELAGVNKGALSSTNPLVSPGNVENGYLGRGAATANNIPYHLVHQRAPPPPTADKPLSRYSGPGSPSTPK